MLFTVSADDASAIVRQERPCIEDMQRCLFEENAFNKTENIFPFEDPIN